ncbi:MAG: hypothetical protein KDI82_07680 [Gammaproteobacteria bacterium]|nr:hypothetical protein [Gammaproteobacteria bacterium]
MNIFDCKKLRLAVVGAIALFAVGLTLQLPRMLFGADVPVLTTLFSGIGLAAVSLSPVVMLGTALLALLPGAAQRLALCER